LVNRIFYIKFDVPKAKPIEEVLVAILLPLLSFGLKRYIKYTRDYLEEK